MEIDALGTAFETRFGTAPTHLVRVPGQVTLLGEELAFHGLPTLALALGREVRLALRVRGDGEVNVRDLRPGGGEVSFEVGVDIQVDPRDPTVSLLTEPARILARRLAAWQGFDAVLASDVPSGLGAQAALRVAVGLTLAEVGELGLGPTALAELLAEPVEATERGEARAAHAVCLGARTGSAVAVAQDPLRTRAVMLPADWRVVVASMGPGGSERPPAWAGRRRSECMAALTEVGRTLVSSGRTPEAPGSWAALFHSLGGPRRALGVGQRVLGGSQLKRFRHLATEAERTREARDALLVADPHTFGTLMDACHGSLRGDYLVSSAGLDTLAAAALEGGARGAHLTGNGGWVVALADVGTVEGVVETLRTHGPGADPEVFVAEPAPGASLAPFPG